MAEEKITLQDTLQALLEGKKYAALRDVLGCMASADIAAIFDEWEKESLSILFRLLPKELAAEAFSEMLPQTQHYLITCFSDAELKQVLNELFADDAADLVEEMPANVVKRILSQASAELRADINHLLRYPAESAGAIMTTEYVSLKSGMTVADALARIRKTGVDKETIYTCYVTQDRKLCGMVTVKDLLLAKTDDVKIDDIMEKNVISVHTHTPEEEVAQALSKYRFLALPVVDSENRIVGIVTFDDAMDVLEEAATEDIEIMAAMAPSETDYAHASVFSLFRQRILWLIVLMISATFTGMIITSFEHALAAQVVLTAFIPMLMNTGGNCGSQSSVSVIRALSLGELSFSDMGHVIWKEIRTSVLCGVVLSVLCFGKILLIDRLLLGQTDVTVMVAAVVCIALALTVFLAKSVGCMLPFLAKRLGFDPAVMASPFITTIVDALSLLIYFAIATILLF
jgi:magnesium transporter